MDHGRDANGERPLASRLPACAAPCHLQLASSAGAAEEMQSLPSSTEFDATPVRSTPSGSFSFTLARRPLCVEQEWQESAPRDEPVWYGYDPVAHPVRFSRRYPRTP